MKTSVCLLLAGLLLSPPAYAANLTIPSLLIDGRAVQSDSAYDDAAKAGGEDCIFFQGEPHRRLWAWLPASQSDVDDLAVGPDGVLYLADTYFGTVGMISLSGERLGTITVNGGGPGFAMHVAVHGGIADPETGEILVPGYVYVRGGDVADADPVEPYVYVYGLDGSFVRRIGVGIGDGLDEFTEDSEGPIGVDPDGNLYVVDSGHTEDGTPRKQIRRYSPGGVSPSIVAVHDDQAGHGHWLGLRDLVGAANGLIYLLDFGLYGSEDPRMIVYGQSGGGAIESWNLLSVALAYGNPTDVENDPVNGRLILSVGTHVLDYDYIGTPGPVWDSEENSGIQAFAYQPGDADFLALGMLPQPYTPLLSLYGRGPMLVNPMLSDYQQVDALGEFSIVADDPSILSICPSDTMIAVAADGVATVLIRQNMPAPGAALVTLTADRPHMAGAIAPLGAEPGPDPITVEAVEVDGQHVLVFQYRGPENYGPEADLVAGEEQFRYDALRIDWNPDYVQASTTLGIPIMRPPVLFVHGLWSGPEAWDEFPGIRNDVRWAGLTRYVDYQASHGSYFSENVRHLYSEIWQIRRDFTRQRIVTAQYDFITHSMGGVLARKLHDTGDGGGTAPANREYSNLGKGHFNKILFVDVPHMGSPAANALSDLADDLVSGNLSVRQRATAGFISPFLKYFIGAGDDQIFAGAIDDLRDDSPALNMANAAIPAYAHIGVGGLISPEWQFNMGMTRLVRLLSDLDPESCWQFAVNNHDAVVIDESQMGYFSPANYTETWDPWCGNHLYVLDGVCATIGALAEQFATTAVDDPFFESVIPAVSPGLSGKSAEHFATPDFAGDGFAISVSGSAIPNGTVTLEVTPNEGVDCEKYFLALNGYVAVLDSAQTSVDFQIPDSWLGPKILGGVAITSDGSVVGAEPVTIDVDTWDFPLEVWTDPGEIEIQEIGGTDVVRVYASFYLGSTRELNDTGRVTYTPTPGDEAIYHVLDDGTVLALAAGEGSLTVRAGSVQTAVPVKVVGEGTVTNPPHAQAMVVGSDQICTGFNVCLDASGSYDLDELLGDDLTFSWDLDGDGAFDDLSGSAPCFEVEAADDYVTYQVKVEDSTGQVAYASGVLTPIYAGCVGVEKVGNALPLEPLDNWTVSRNGDIYHVQHESDLIIRYNADGQVVSSVLPDPVYYMGISSSLAGTADGSLYYIAWDRYPDGTSTYHWVLGHVAPDGTHTRSLLPDGDADPPNSCMGASDTGYLYYTCGSADEPRLVKMTTDGTLVKDGIIDVPNQMLNVKNIVCGADGDVFIHFGDGDSRDQVLKVQELSSGLTVDPGWGADGFLEHSFRYIRGIALDEELRLTATVIPVFNDPTSVALFDSEGVLQGMRTHYLDGTRMDPLSKIGSLGGGRFVYAENDTLTLTQIYPSGVSAVPDDQDPGGGDSMETQLRSALSLPNPVATGGRIEIGYRFPGGSQAVELMIYDLRGALVRTLVREQMLGGNYRVAWDLRDERGRSLPSGVYLARLKTADGIRTGKMVLIK